VHPEVITVMRELGLDLSREVPQKLTLELARGATHLVTLGCGEQCPYIPGAEVEDWPLPDPRGQRLDDVREIRDAVEARVRRFVDARGWARHA
jgi:arsenate reductase